MPNKDLFTFIPIGNVVMTQRQIVLAKWRIFFTIFYHYKFLFKEECEEVLCEKEYYLASA